MNKLILAAMVMSVSGGVMAASGDDVVASGGGVQFTLNSPIVLPSCSLNMDHNSGVFSSGATLTVGGAKVASNAKITASFAGGSSYQTASNLKVEGTTATADMNIAMGDFVVSIDDNSATDTSANIIVEATCVEL